MTPHGAPAETATEEERRGAATAEAADPAGQRRDSMLEEVTAGLSRTPKRLPSKYFYDERGSQLFDQITQLDEYYLTRAETWIMERFAAEMAAEIGAGALVVEPGAGSGAKTRLLLEHLESPAAYVPVDISGTYLFEAARRLSQDCPDVPVLPLVGDFTRQITLPTPPTRPQRRVVYFPGSTIGNFTPLEATRLLARMRSLVGPGGAVLIGFDLLKDVAVLEAAYDDADGVTARFNRNVLAHINDALGADFDPSAFEHDAPFNVEAARIEMYLVSSRDQSVSIGGRTFEFERDEPILTEYSSKYTLDSFGELASSAGLVPARTWTDEGEMFCVQLLVVAAR